MPVVEQRITSIAKQLVVICVDFGNKSCYNFAGKSKNNMNLGTVYECNNSKNH